VRARILSLALGLAVCAALPAAGTSGADFLKVLPSARSAGLAGCLVAGDGIASLEANPAGLAGLEAAEATFTHLSWLQGFSMEHGAAALPLGPGALAATVSLMGSGDIPALDAQGQDAGTFSQQDLAAGLAYGARLSSLRLGLSARYLSRSLAGRSATGFAGDLGAALPLGGGFSLGLAGQNLGSLSALESEADPLPLTLRGGLAWKNEGPSGVALEVGASKPQDSAVQARAGLEGRFDGMLFGRAGLNYSPELDGRGLFTLGGGLRYLGFQFDYAFTPFGLLGNAHRLSLTALFGEWTKKAEAERRSLAEAPAELLLTPSAGRLDVRWQAPPGKATAGYYLWLRKGPGKPLLKVNAKPSPHTFAALKGLDPGVEYGIAVSAVDVDGMEGPRTDELTARPEGGAAAKAGPPAAPKGLKASRDGQAVVLVWQANTEADLLGYQVYHKARVNGGWVALQRQAVAGTRFEAPLASLQGGAGQLAVKAVRRLPGSGVLESDFSAPVQVPAR
jgi:hypothetical protein